MQRRRAIEAHALPQTVLRLRLIRVNSITLCKTLNATNGKIVFVTPDLRQSGMKVKYVTYSATSPPTPL